MLPVRFLTAAALFDGHDAAINVIRRVLQDAGCEVIHLGHNRGVLEIARAAIQEDVDGIAISSYQGGHVEFFKFLIDQLNEADHSHIKIFGGGGGVILPHEIQALHDYGVAKIYSPEEGMKIGLEGMAIEMVEVAKKSRDARPAPKIVMDFKKWGRTMTALEVGAKFNEGNKEGALVLGITGTGGAGKSSLTDELVLRFLYEYPKIKIAIYSVDPTKRKTGGALLGDRIRMNSIDSDQVFMRSLATRGADIEVTAALEEMINASKTLGFDLIIVETPGIGQGASAVTKISDHSLYVMTAEYGAATQLEKIDMIDFADFITINKFDRRGSEDALQAVKKQYCRSHKLFNPEQKENLPIFGTRCNIYNDKGVTMLYRSLRERLLKKSTIKKERDFLGEFSDDAFIVPPARIQYLQDISKTVKTYKERVRQEIETAADAYALARAATLQKEDSLKEASSKKLESLSESSRKLIDSWPARYESYQQDEVTYQVRGKDVRVPQAFESLSGLNLKRVSVPKLRSWDQILEFCALENLPGYFPYCGGIYPFKRQGEDPRRQFAGEGSPERTNKRFHYLTKNDEFHRLSTAFDSVTLYGEDPHERPDIYGKVGESGVSIATLEDMETLYRGFDLCSPKTSVSMTINGPAPIILAFFLNTAINQQVKLFEKKEKRSPNPQELQAIKAQTLSHVRGTVQADILKEDQAQNTCIFSTEFALRMMGDIQDYFIRHEVRNYYSVSISGYHIAEAGANPISQLAFTLANGFTLVEYYLSRGMKIDEFAPNLSFFFSNGLDPEYSVIGRVARRIWAIAMRDRYGANERSQKLKYHIQTSGRSLHAQEIEFNDIRTTLQALTAIYDNCNSLHTNAYDEAITTPTEESVRRAMAVQMIINKEYGNSKTENILQGSYVIQELTELVEEAILSEFERLSHRGGVLGAMEMQYQRSKIQEESLYYETLKHDGQLPIIGVNTFLSENSKEYQSIAVARSNSEEKNLRLQEIQKFLKANQADSEQALENLKKIAQTGGNIFEELMEVTKVCSLGQISHALYEVGGRYRRNM